MKTFTYHTDPGHGWLEVPRALLYELGIRDKITGYSYQKGEAAYLEEDLDAFTFICAYKNANGIDSMKTVEQETRLSIRDFPRLKEINGASGRAYEFIKKYRQVGLAKPGDDTSEFPFYDARKPQEEIDREARKEAMAEIQAEPLTAPQVDHSELFPEALEDAEGQKMLF